jgi:hypothetical protein
VDHGRTDRTCQQLSDSPVSAPARKDRGYRIDSAEDDTAHITHFVRTWYDIAYKAVSIGQLNM